MLNGFPKAKTPGVYTEIRVKSHFYRDDKTMNSLQKESTSRSLSSECLSREHFFPLIAYIYAYIFGIEEYRGKATESQMHDIANLPHPH